MVDSQRDRSAQQDPAMAQVAEQLQAMLDALIAERTPVAEVMPEPPAAPVPVSDAITINSSVEPATS
jgi:hypothetical protein